MIRFVKRLSKKVGLLPGTLIHIGEEKVEKTRITIIDYDEAQMQEKEAKNIEECFSFIYLRDVYDFFGNKMGDSLVPRCFGFILTGL